MLVTTQFSLGAVKVPWPKTHVAEQSHLQVFEEMLLGKMMYKDMSKTLLKYSKGSVMS